MKESSKKIMKAFEQKAFIPFIMLADPDYDSTIAIANTLADNGASIIELGLPARQTPLDGPSVLAAHQRALANQLTDEKLFDLIAEIIASLDIPVIIMAYMSALKEYGFENIITKLVELGIDGMIVPDMTDDDMDEYSQIIDQTPLSFIKVVNPSMTDEQIKTLVQQSEGFLYVAAGSKTGTTSNSLDEIANLIHISKTIREIPAAIGFGIRTPADAREKSEISDGVIIGSAIVDIIAEHGVDSPQYLQQFTQEIVSSII